MPVRPGTPLLGYAAAGQSPVTAAWAPVLFWRAERDAPAATVRSLVLLGADGQEVYRLSGPPVDGWYPFDRWRAGEVVRDPLWLIPQAAGLTAGPYRFGVTVDGGGFVPLGEVVFGR